MSAKSLDVFSLRDAVVGEYKNFATSFTTIRAQDIRQQVEAIYADQRYWPEPLIQINPSYKRSTNVEALANANALHPGCSAIFRTGVSPMPVCTPYRGALLTGRTPLSLGLVLNDIPLATTETSLAHATARAGYDTAYIGKWHLNGGDRPAWVAEVPAGLPDG